MPAKNSLKFSLKSELLHVLKLGAPIMFCLVVLGSVILAQPVATKAPTSRLVVAASQKSTPITPPPKTPSTPTPAPVTATPSKPSTPV